MINNGREDLSNLNLNIFDKISPDGASIEDFGIWKTIGERTEKPAIRSENGRVAVTFSILRPGEGVDVWIANRGYSMFDVRNIQPGLDVEEVESGEDWDIGFGELMVLLGAIFVSFVGGAIAGEAANNHMLKKVGFDPKELLEAYNEANKKNGK